MIIAFKEFLWKDIISNEKDKCNEMKWLIPTKVIVYEVLYFLCDGNCLMNYKKCIVSMNYERGFVWFTEFLYITFWYWMLNLWCGHVVIYLADWFSQLYGTRINAKSWLNFCGKNQTYYRYNCIQHSKVNRVRQIWYKFMISI